MEFSKLLGVVAFICFSTIPITASSSNGQFKLRVNLTRRAGEGLNPSERMTAAVDRSKKRLNAIEAFIKKQIGGAQLDADTPVEAGNGDFLMSIAVGTPSVSFQAIVDTGSDLIWTQCEPCENCFSQPAPIFDPSKSSSYSTVSCNDSLCDALDTSKTACNPDCAFRYSYGDASETIGDLAKETFTIGTGTGSKVSDIAFGCGHNNQGFDEGTDSMVAGLVGLGRGDLSLISQLGSKVDNKFSYCLVSITDSPSQTSPLIFGDTASFRGAKTVQLINNSAVPTFWYIPVTGITLNGKAVDIPAGTFDLGSDGSGGMIIDSGTTLTYLVEAAYDPVIEAIQSSIDLTPADNDPSELCYQKSSDVTLPTLIFNFGGGVDIEIPGENLFRDGDNNNSCLALDKSSSDVSIFGNVFQQNFHILYDNARNTLSFTPANCDSL